jgi:hypothetical protein
VHATATAAKNNNQLKAKSCTVDISSGNNNGIDDGNDKGNGDSG